MGNAKLILCSSVNPAQHRMHENTDRGNMHIIILTDESRLMIKSLISMQTYQNLIVSTNFILNDSVPVFGTKTSNSTLRNLAFTQGRHSNEYNRARTADETKTMLDRKTKDAFLTDDIITMC